jgi:D-mannonate dehydratase
MIKVEDHAHLRTLLLAHKVINEKYKTTAAHNNMCIKLNYKYNLRNINTFEVNISSYNYMKRVSDNACISWNNLNNTQNNILNRSKFKEKITEDIKKSYTT